MRNNVLITAQQAGQPVLDKHTKRVVRDRVAQLLNPFATR